MEMNLMNINNQFVVSSREVAENLGKQHKNVIRDLESIMKFDSSNLSHQIIKSEYENVRSS